MVGDQTGVSSRNLIGADRRADAAAANCNSALHFPSGYRLREGNDEIGVVVTRIEAVRAEVDYFMSRRTQTSGQIFLQGESAVIRGDPYAHITAPSLFERRPAA